MRCFKPLSFILFVVIITSLKCANSSEVTVEASTISLGSKFKLKSQGAFRLEAGTHGTSRFGWSAGPIAVAEDGMIYAAGHVQHYSVGAFILNEDPGFGSIDKLPIAANTQPFVKISPLYTPQKSANRITGIETFDNQLLLMNDEYYDANGNNNEFLTVLENRLNLDNSKQIGFFPITAKSHAAGWMSEIPEPLSKELNALYLAGSASNIPINGRHSIGPSLFTWFPFYLENVKPMGSTVTMAPLIDYSLDNPLHPDLNNKNGSNDLWTELSYAAYGFISPDQTSYIVIGHSGGHESGIRYKITQENNRKCGGFCATDYKDYYNYYWIYSVEDIKKSFSGELQPHEVKPVEYGKLPLLDYRYLIKGADFNRKTNQLYLSTDKVDRTQSKFESQPIIWTFELVENER